MSPGEDSAIEIRAAKPQDAPSIASLLHSLGYPAEPAEVQQRLRDLDASADDRVLLTEGGLVAVHRVLRLAEAVPLARITALVVLPQRRRQGVARALVNAAEDAARAWGCGELEVSSGLRPERAAAHAFYEALGFSDARRSSAYYRRRVRPE